MRKLYRYLWKKKLSGDQRGVAAIEFAIALPFLVLVFVGAVDVTRFILVHQKLERAAFTVGDLVSQLQTEVGVCGFIGAWRNTVVRDIMRPFNINTVGAGFNMGVTSVVMTGFGPIKEWRYNMGYPSLLGGGGVPSVPILPTGFGAMRMNERTIVTEMRYRFRPIMPLYGATIGSNTPFRKAYFMRGRRGGDYKGYQSGNLSGC